jgi:hypothetical protein
MMMKTIPAVMGDDQIRLLEPVVLQPGQRLLVTILADSDEQFWTAVSQSTLETIWDNEEDDIYAELLKK